MYEPSATIGKNNNFQININPILILRYINPNVFQESKTDFQNNSYKITPRNHYRIVKFFNDVIQWFYDKDMEDLFLTNDDNQLVFNADYNNLHLLLRPIGKDSSYLKAVPVMIENQDGKREEGICLSINIQANTIEMPLFEVEALFHALSDFNFSNEALLTMMSYASAKNHEKLLSEDKWRMNTIKNIKTPFDK
jgi:hypothetical protein